MQPKTRTCTLAAATFLVFSFALASMAAGAGSITLPSTPQAPGGTVPISGTSFGATKAVGIGLGAEVTVSGEVHNITNPAGYGPFTAIVNHYPIKPGSFSFHCDVSDVTSDYYDSYANGTLATTSTYAVNPFVNYVTGEFGRSTNSPWDGYIVSFTANYTYYQYNVTPAAGVNTTASGAFSTSFTVPGAVTNGNYGVTVLDTVGNIAVGSLAVDVAIPENLTIGAVVLLSSIAVIVGSRYIKKRLGVSK